MSLRTRLTLTVLGVLTFTVAAVIIVTELAFVSQQQRELGELLVRELVRVENVVRAGQIGADLVTDGEGALQVQFVGRDGSVLLPDPGRAALPLHVAPTLERAPARLEGAWLVASVPWRLSTGAEVGTLRGAISLARLEGARADLRRALLTIGLAALLLAGVIVVLSVQRSLTPLARFATDTRSLDPAHPRVARYEGPADEVGQVAHALNAALEAIGERRRMERERLADVAHELAAPLTVVRAHVEDLVRRAEVHPPRDAAVAQRLQAARTAAEDLLHVSQDLLTLARGDLDERMRWEVVDVTEVLGEMKAVYPSMEVAWDPDVDLRVVADPARLRQVFRNLLRNAVRAAGSDAGVHLRALAVGGHPIPALVEIRVEDDGPGLTEAQAVEIFGRYHTRTGGTGLGLAVVERLTERMGGVVTAAARAEGRGARFTLRFPSFLSSQEDVGDEVEG